MGTLHFAIKVISITMWIFIPRFLHKTLNVCELSRNYWYSQSWKSKFDVMYNAFSFVIFPNALHFCLKMSYKRLARKKPFRLIWKKRFWKSNLWLQKGSDKIKLTSLNLCQYFNTTHSPCSVRGLKPTNSMNEIFLKLKGTKTQV